jgi:hypothetical protein
MKPINTKLTDAEKLRKLTQFLFSIDVYRDADAESPLDNEEKARAFEDILDAAKALSDECSWCDVVTFDLPSRWASALINDDWSGLEEEEAQEVIDWLAANGNPDFCSVDNDRVERGNDATDLLCDTSTYSVLVPKAEPTTA